MTLHVITGVFYFFMHRALGGDSVCGTGLDGEGLQDNFLPPHCTTTVYKKGFIKYQSLYACEDFTL